MSKIEFSLANLADGKAPLYTQYAGQYKPQPAWITLDEDGTVSAWEHDDNGVPANVWNGRTRTWSVIPQANGADLAEWLQSEKISALLQRVHDGHEDGRLTEDAREAEEEIGYALERAIDCGEIGCVQIWDAGDWMQYETIDDVIKAGSLKAWNQMMEDAIEADQVLHGSCAEAMAERIKEEVADLEDDLEDDADAEKSARLATLKKLLADYDAEE